MQFQVPQFIETEDRIIGPLTLKQFLYIAAGGGLSFALFFTLQTFLWLLITVIIFTVSLSFAFIKINGQSFFTVAVAAFNFYWHPRFYLWQREEKALEMPKISATTAKTAQIKSRLDNLWEQLKTSKNPLPKREKAIKPSILEQIKSKEERFEIMRKITGEKEIAKRIDYR